MKGYVARAMQVAAMSGVQIADLHERELALGYLIPNWNIQTLFKLPLLKDRWSIPENAEALAAHAGRIENEIDRAGLTKVDAVEQPGIDAPTNLLWTHAFDWTVNHRSGDVTWEYSGAGRRGGSVLGNLRREEPGEE